MRGSMPGMGYDAVERLLLKMLIHTLPEFITMDGAHKGDRLFRDRHNYTIAVLWVYLLFLAMMASATWFGTSA